MISIDSTLGIVEDTGGRWRQRFVLTPEEVRQALHLDKGAYEDDNVLISMVPAAVRMANASLSGFHVG